MRDAHIIARARNLLSVDLKLSLIIFDSHLVCNLMHEFICLLFSLLDAFSSLIQSIVHFIDECSAVIDILIA